MEVGAHVHSPVPLLLEEGGPGTNWIGLGNPRGRLKHSGEEKNHFLCFESNPEPSIVQLEFADLSSVRILELEGTKLGQNGRWCFYFHVDKSVFISMPLFK
jgi:hypothetical protein